MKFSIYDKESKAFGVYEMEDISQDYAIRMAEQESSTAAMTTALYEMRQEMELDISKTYRLQNELTIRSGHMEENIMTLEGKIAEFDIICSELRRRIEVTDEKMSSTLNSLSDRLMALEIASIQRSRDGYKVAFNGEFVNSENLVSTVAALKEDVNVLKDRIGDMMISLGVDRINEVNLALSRFEAKLESVSGIKTEWGSMQSWLRSEIMIMNASLSAMKSQLTPTSKKTVGKTASCSKEEGTS